MQGWHEKSRDTHHSIPLPQLPPIKILRRRDLHADMLAVEDRLRAEGIPGPVDEDNARVREIALDDWAVEALGIVLEFVDVGVDRGGDCEGE